MKKIILIFALLMMCACSVTSKEPVETASPEPSSQPSAQTGCAIDEECKDEEEEIENYEKLISTNTFKHITLAESVNMIENKETAVYLYGFKTCPWCQDVITYLKDAADEAGVIINYINVRVDGDTKEFDIRNENNSDYVKLQNIFKDIMMDETNKIYVPLVVAIKDGEIIGYNYATVDGHDATEREMNEEEVEKLKVIYQEIFEKYKN